MNYIKITFLGVETPEGCKSICESVADCTHFTWQDGKFCYLVNSPYWLHYDDDKVFFLKAKRDHF